MLQENMQIKIKNGSDARILAEFVQVANYYSCGIYLEKDGKRMMGMMSMGLIEGEEVLVLADGEREAEAMESIRQFLKD
jgi:phosphotransferase system HPr (HPr) family protein